MIETELKVKLDTIEDYKEIMNYLGDSFETKKQVNFFFDNKNMELTNQNILFRIRNENDKWIATVKYGKIIKNGVHSCNEFEEEFSECPEFTCGNLFNIFNELTEYKFTLNLDELQCIGSFKNKRNVYRFLDNINLELDRTDYSCEESYEIELEGNLESVQLAEIKLQHIFSELDMEYKYQADGKFKRFLKIINF